MVGPTNLQEELKFVNGCPSQAKFAEQTALLWQGNLIIVQDVVSAATLVTRKFFEGGSAN